MVSKNTSTGYLIPNVQPSDVRAKKVYKLNRVYLIAIKCDYGCQKLGMRRGGKW